MYIPSGRDNRFAPMQMTPQETSGSGRRADMRRKAAGKLEPAQQDYQFPSQFTSEFEVRSPFSGSLMRQASQVPQAFRGMTTPGGSSGDMSRSAYARALADSGRNNMTGAMDKYRQEYQLRAEQARSNDLLSQKQDAIARYALDKDRQQTIRQQDARYREQRRDIQAFRRQAAADASQNTLFGVLGGLVGGGGLYSGGGMPQAVGEALAKGATPFGSVPGFIGLQGLLNDVRPLPRV